ncbi:transcriptional repressor [Patescibacteria group bacterium]|nr:transcriptional repressor [Patescibacteria group bacterium]MBU0964423.1 transcriptional repressor [Patescibacteria group bacterium]
MATKIAKISEKRDYRLTKQRLIILEQVRKNYAHPTADVIFNQVKKRISSISLGTVYRNLRWLAEHGLLKEFMIGKVSHFEARVDSHVHFVCEQCHGIEDLEGYKDKGLIKQLQSLAKKNKFMIRSENYEVRGICKKCRKTASPKKLVPELFCIACGSLNDDLKQETPVCQACSFKVNCNYIKK